MRYIPRALIGGPNSIHLYSPTGNVVTIEKNSRDDWIVRISTRTGVTIRAEELKDFASMLRDANKFASMLKAGVSTDSIASKLPVNGYRFETIAATQKQTIQPDGYDVEGEQEDNNH